MTKPDDSAHPEITSEKNRDFQVQEVYSWGGLTKREEFSKAAMIGILSGLWSAPDGHGWRETDIAEQSVKQADALITALNNNN